MPIEMKHLIILCCTITNIFSQWEEVLNPKLSLGRPCQRYQDCDDEGATCTSKEICQCNFGFFLQKVDDRLVCRLKTCQESAECTELYGENIVCDYGHCKCPSGYVFIKSVCTSPYHPIGDHCNSTNSNGPLTSCTPQKKIACRIGTYQLNKVACRYITCHNSEQCTKYMPNTECSDDSTLCRCHSAFHDDHTETQCLPGKRRHDSCSLNTDCGKNAACASGFCTCKSGYRPTLNDLADCEQIVCKTNRDCTSMDVNTYCTHIAPHNNTCICKAGKILDQSKQYCTDYEESNRGFSTLAVLVICLLSILLISVNIFFLYMNRTKIRQYFK